MTQTPASPDPAHEDAPHALHDEPTDPDAVGDPIPEDGVPDTAEVEWEGDLSHTPAPELGDPERPGGDSTDSAPGSLTGSAVPEGITEVGSPEGELG